MRNKTIYIIRNRCNDKVYIGQTSQSVSERFGQHLKPSTYKKRGSYKIYNAMQKYGKSNFYYEILEENVDVSVADEREIFYIDKYDSFKNGYNSTNGGNSKTICKIMDIEIIVKLFHDNVKYSDIAKMFGVNEATVIRTLNSLGLRRKNKITKEIALSSTHLTNIEIAKIHNVDPITVGRAFRKYNIKRGTGCSNHLNKQNQIRKSASTIPQGSRAEDKLPPEASSNSKGVEDIVSTIGNNG